MADGASRLPEPGPATPPGPPGPRRIGLIVNPLAGIGGRVGLKGSDGQDIVDRAFALGAVPLAPTRATDALRILAAITPPMELATYAGVMGADEARAAGLAPLVLGSIGPSVRTTAEDTRRAARDLVGWGAELILFAGGDGTARDIVSAVGDAVPVVGIPAGVKIHSSVFATTPRHAGDLVRAFIEGPVRLEPMEVMDVDEAGFREGRVSARLYGYLRVPFVRSLVQRAKAGSRSDPSTVRAVAFGVLAAMAREPDAWYILGPGSTVRAVGDELGIDTTLLGVDVVHLGRLVATDVTERDLLGILASVPGRPARLVVSVIGGQGYILGRGNQQLSPAVVRAVGPDGLLVIATLDKLHALDGPLRVDTGDEELDRALAGHIRVVIGERDEVVWRVSG